MSNIIFLMADQLRYDLLDAYGDQQCDTPNLDALADEATVFEHHYTICPLCVPARSSLMTGLYPRQHGAIINGWFPEEREHGTVNANIDLIPNRIADQGYDVYHAGIQHVRTTGGFEKACPNVNFIGPSSVGKHHRMLHKKGLMLPDMSVFRNPVLEHSEGKQRITAGTSARTAVWPLREDLFYDSVVCKNIVKTINEHDKSNPLCLCGMFWLPHPPLWAPRKWAHKYHPDQVNLPPTIGKWYQGMPALQLANTAGQLGSHVPTEHWAHVWAMYMGMTSLLDDYVGQVIDALKENDLYDDTMIVFTSDHGEMLGSHRLFQKMCLYEESVRVPLMVKTPGQKSARRVIEMTDHLDLTAAMVEQSGAAAIEDSTGKSLLPLANGQPNNRPRKTIFAAYDGSSGQGYVHRMVRTNTHKFIHNIGDKPELYDMIEDPHETRNYANHPKVAPLQNKLASLLNGWMDQLDDPHPKAELMRESPRQQIQSADPGDSMMGSS